MADTGNMKYPSLNREEINAILQKIGDKCLLTVNRNRKNKIVPKVRRQNHYFTAGASLDTANVSRLEQKKHEAFRLPTKETSMSDTTQLGSVRSFHTYHSRLHTQVLERLYVPDDIRLPGKSITQDIDPNYYTVVGDRPIKESSNLQDYIWAVRTSFLTKKKIQVLQEEINLMKNIRTDEEVAFKETQDTLNKRMEALNQFLEEDYQRSIDLLREAETTLLETQKLEEETAKLKKELESVQTRVTLLEEQWRSCQMLQQFLYNAAPLSWRKLYDSTQKKNGPNDKSERSLSGRLLAATTAVMNEMKPTISWFSKEVQTSDEPVLYFNDPDQLFAVLQELEDRNLSLLLQCKRLQPSVLTMDKALKEAQRLCENERAAMAEDVAELRRVVESDETKANNLEKEAKTVCNNQIHKYLTDKEYINLTASLEDVYERVIGPNDTGLGPVDMMRALETKHEQLRLQLDMLPSALVQRITNTWEKQQKTIMKEAKIASKKVHQMNMLVKRFSNALKPSKSRHTRRLMRRSQPPKEKVKEEAPPKQLTAAELEYRYFFEQRTAETNRDHMYRPLL